MSQGDLASKGGLQPSAISHFETGSRAPSFDNLKLLADALSVTTDYLLGRADDPGASGPEAGSLFRHAKGLSAEDLKTLTSLAKVLAEKNMKKAGSS